MATAPTRSVRPPTTRPPTPRPTPITPPRPPATPSRTNPPVTPPVSRPSTAVPPVRTTPSARPGTSVTSPPKSSSLPLSPSSNVGRGGSNNGGDDGGINGAAVAGIVVGLIAVLVGSVIGGFLLLKQRRKRLMLVGRGNHAGSSRKYGGYPGPDLNHQPPKPSYRRGSNHQRAASGSYGHYGNNDDYEGFSYANNRTNVENRGTYDVYDDKSYHAAAAGLGGARRMMANNYTNDETRQQLNPRSRGENERSAQTYGTGRDVEIEKELTPQEQERERQLDLQMQARLLSLAGEGKAAPGATAPPLSSPKAYSPLARSPRGPYPFPPRPISNVHYFQNSGGGYGYNSNNIDDRMPPPQHSPDHAAYSAQYQKQEYYDPQEYYYSQAYPSDEYPQYGAESYGNGNAQGHTMVHHSYPNQQQNGPSQQQQQLLQQQQQHLSSNSYGLIPPSVVGRSREQQQHNQGATANARATSTNNVSKSSHVSAQGSPDVSENGPSAEKEEYRESVHGDVSSFLVVESTPKINN
ncbi:hypothetical protein BCR41DRAFT_347111 [Lobosporangium transversale]|uniref:Uncharacterized protein n=1 Tax=Lobosporangium transversale TaxID=64571 RepID=A0A1Y2GXB7_9FUNG|nr:hypothetical protein BCR41DRAFT_347111 [Lobosporangium transversale]ORZ26948.1 hypothetical protein BCR41DRAFT_347111 [Lobosporangium transversale]|eukprot:XP_021884695.1 hypothetical protein BCR41DRAFT_347111 [Lobosporangium transversale]